MFIKERIKAQSTIEFTFAVIAIMFIIYGMVQVFRWAGMDLAQRQWSQESQLIVNPVGIGDPSQQLTPSNIVVAMPLSAVYHGSITNGNNGSP